MKKILFFGSIFACLTVGQGSFSQETYELEQIVISGGNAPISSSDLATSHTIITREEIERGANKTITSILRSVPGLNVSSAGGSTTQIRMRGGEGNHTLVLNEGDEGTAGEVVGTAKGFSYGPAFKFEYVLLVPVKGREMKITFDDWIFMHDERVAIIRATMTKFGIKVAELTVMFVKD